MKRTSTFGGMVYLCVVAATLAGVLIAGLGAWRAGAAVMGVALLVGAGFRSVLPAMDAGMLRVRRNRWADVAMLVTAGAALLLLAGVVPDQLPGQGGA